MKSTTTGQSSLDAVSQSIIALTNQKMKNTAIPPAPYNGGSSIVQGNTLSGTIVEVHQKVNALTSNFQNQLLGNIIPPPSHQSATIKRKQKLLDTHENPNLPRQESDGAISGDFCEQNDDTFAEEIDRNEEDGMYTKDQQFKQSKGKEQTDQKFVQPIVIDEDNPMNNQKKKSQENLNLIHGAEKGDDNWNMSNSRIKQDHAPIVDQRSRSPVRHPRDAENNLGKRGQFVRDGNSFVNRKQNSWNNRQSFEAVGGANVSGKARNFDRGQSYGNNNFQSYQQNYQLGGNTGRAKAGQFQENRYQHKTQHGHQSSGNYGSRQGSYTQHDQHGSSTGPQRHSSIYQNRFNSPGYNSPTRQGHYSASNNKPPLIENSRGSSSYQESGQRNNDLRRSDSGGYKRYDDENRRYFDRVGGVQNRQSNFDRGVTQSGNAASDRSRSDHNSDRSFQQQRSERSPEASGRDFQRRENDQNENSPSRRIDKEDRSGSYFRVGNRDDYNNSQRYQSRDQNQNYQQNRVDQQNTPNTFNNQQHHHNNYHHGYRGGRGGFPNNNRGRPSSRDRDIQYDDNYAANSRRPRSRSREKEGNQRIYRENNTSQQYSGDRDLRGYHQSYQYQQQNNYRRDYYGYGRGGNYDEHGHNNFVGRGRGRGTYYQKQDNRNFYHNRFNDRQEEKGPHHQGRGPSQEKKSSRELEFDNLKPQHDVTKKQVVAASSPSRPILEIEIRKSSGGQKKQNLNDSQLEPGEVIASSGPNDVIEGKQPGNNDKSDSMPDSFRSPQSNLSEYIAGDHQSNKNVSNEKKQTSQELHVVTNRDQDDSREQPPIESDQKVSKLSDNGDESKNKKQQFVIGTVADELFNDGNEEQDSLGGDEDGEQQFKPQQPSVQETEVQDFIEGKVVEEIKEGEKNPEIEVKDGEAKETDYLSVEQPEPQEDHEQEKEQEHKQVGDDVDPAHNCNVYVAGIPKRSTEDTLRKVFSKFGSIQQVNIIKDHQTKVPRGFAYILYSQAKEANAAIAEMDQTMPFNDWKIKVEHAKRTTANQVLGTQHQDQAPIYQQHDNNRLHKYHSDNRFYDHQNNYYQDGRSHSNNMGHHHGYNQRDSHHHGYNQREGNMNRSYADSRGYRDNYQSGNYQHRDYNKQQYHSNYGQRQDFHKDYQKDYGKDFPQRGQFGYNRGGYNKSFENRNTAEHQYRDSFENEKYNNNQQQYWNNRNFDNSRYSGRDYNSTNRYRSRSRSPPHYANQSSQRGGRGNFQNWKTNQDRNQED